MQQENYGRVRFAGRAIKHPHAIGFDPADGCVRQANRTSSWLGAGRFAAVRDVASLISSLLTSLTFNAREIPTKAQLA